MIITRTPRAPRVPPRPGLPRSSDDHHQNASRATCAATTGLVPVERCSSPARSCRQERHHGACLRGALFHGGHAELSSHRSMRTSVDRLVTGALTAGAAVEAYALPQHVGWPSATPSQACFGLGQPPLSINDDSSTDPSARDACLVLITPPRRRAPWWERYMIVYNLGQP